MSFRMPIALVLLALVACQPQKPSTGEKSQEARTRNTAHALQQEDEARTAKKTGVSKGERDDEKGLSNAEQQTVVAQIGDFKITLGDVERQLAAQPTFARARYRVLEKKIEFVHNLVQFELLAMEAQKKGYDTDPDVVLAMKRAMIQKFTQNDLQSLVTVSTVSEEETARYYQNNTSMFNKPAFVRASHVQLNDEATATAMHKELSAAIGADRPRARTIFSEFARRQSKDTQTAFVNGDLNFFSKDGYGLTNTKGTARIDSAIVQAAFALKRMGEISGVVKSAKAFHIVQLTNKRPAVNRTLDDARRQITNILLREKKDLARSKYIADLKTKADITIFPEQLKGLNVDGIQGTRSQPPSPASIIPALRKPPSPRDLLTPRRLDPRARQNLPEKVRARTDQRPQPGANP